MLPSNAYTYVTTTSIIAAFVGLGFFFLAAGTVHRTKWAILFLLLAIVSFVVSGWCLWWLSVNANG